MRIGTPIRRKDFLGTENIYEFETARGFSLAVFVFVFDKNVTRKTFVISSAARNLSLLRMQKKERFLGAQRASE
jgi:hypothetical protein